MKLNNAELYKFTPWDSVIFGVETYEILSAQPFALEQALQHPGHYTVKMDPLASKKVLHDYGFYYCDTLIEPYCDQKRLLTFEKDQVEISPAPDLSRIIKSCENVFLHGRFHRDFNLENEIAEKRYTTWVSQLFAANKVYELVYLQEIAGFIAADNGKLVLHALNENIRGQGMAKYFWSKLCKMLFENGVTEITSSISAANLAIVNLYASLGFRFRNSVDVYHRVVK